MIDSLKTRTRNNFKYKKNLFNSIFTIVDDKK